MYYSYIIQSLYNKVAMWSIFMIDWQLTLIQYNRTDLHGSRPMVVVSCDKCQSTKSIRIRRKSDVMDGQIPWECTACVANRPDKVEKSRTGALKAWQNQEYAQKVCDNTKRNWSNVELAKRMNAFKHTDSFKEKMTEVNKAKILTEKGRKSISEHSKKRWLNKDYRSNVIEAISQYNLEKWKDKEYREHISSVMKSKWCDKEYRARLTKAVYASCNNKIIGLLQYWLGISDIPLVNFEFNEIQIKQCEAVDYKPLLEKYHCLSNAGRGGIAYGAYHGDIPIAVCVFSPLPRQNITVGDCSNPRELSRLCIHPGYQRKNFGSWFISRCIKMLPQQYDGILTYADTTFNHDGAVYKAANFKFDGEVRPDYWYAAEDGWVMHKKTLYNQARNLKLTERQFADAFGYLKIYGDKKLRFIYIR